MTIDELKNAKLGFCASGGLDSRTLARKLVEVGADVVCFTADLGQPDEALAAINRALALGRDTRSSVLLKSKILEVLGRGKEARRHRQDAQTLPRMNWSENLAVK